ncbi:metallophosphoesterase [Pedobacter ginsengisoli]|uniref:metallophosphoesterase n=1 Tax=Pedobacter ginsengisoli TaxID=363852 RepID=UPI00254CE16C|nr:metallophosphoesterase [Pedobacter ginsengisoli]
MRNLFIIILALFFQQGAAQKLHDGPYVVYKEEEAFVKQVTDSVATEKEIPLGGDVAVTFPGNPNWNFSVPLRKDLQIEPVETPLRKKLFIVSDIEGEFKGFRELLIANKVINETYEWTFGKGHLVICGDLFDRGLNVPECLWLIYKLEDLAKAKGGYVHTILGNHDIMNLSGDLRYVQPKYFESAKLMEIDYMRLYDSNTELGRWLRTKNIIEKIGDNLCTHAGVAPQINKLGLSLKAINEKCRPYYDKAGNVKAAGDTTAAKFFEGKTSLFWYRGYFREPKATEEEVDETLKLYDVKRIIVGHTIVPGNVGLHYNGKVLGLDVDQHSGDHQAALYENGKWYKVNDKGNKIELKN